MTEESVTVWLRRIGQGDQEAARQLWIRYSPHLERLARARFQDSLNAAFDEQDLVQSVFHALWKGAAAGNLDGVRDRTELWWLLLAITRRKAVNRLEHNARLKRGEAALSLSDADTGSSGSTAGQFDVAGDVPPPELILMLQEEQERLMANLRDDTLRTIAVWKLEGYTHGEIAGKLGVATRTVIRKLNLIRETWSEELDA